MGIKDLNKILKKYCPNAFQTIPISNLKGYRVAIDGPIWLHRNLSICLKDIIMNMPDPLAVIDRNLLLYKVEQALLRFTITWCYKGVTLVWVWDGEALPEKVVNAKKNRSEIREKIKTNIETLRVKLENTHMLARSPADVVEYKKILCQDLNISKNDVEHICNFIKNLGFPCLTAPNDSEKLCASLAKEGLVAGVWSNDTDCHTFGAPMLINDWGLVDSEGESTINVVYTPIVLHLLKMTESEFIDMCIMLECDFNSRIPNVGEVKVYNFITQYRNIETIKLHNPGLQWDILNHERCREIFKYTPSGINSEILNINFNLDVKVNHNLNDLLNSLKFIIPPKNVTFN